MAAARRQSSTTSLSRYARMASPDLSNRSLDFCNAFWGPADGGVDVLLARMRGASRTMEELRSFWKERYVRLLLGFPVGCYDFLAKTFFLPWALWALLKAVLTDIIYFSHLGLLLKRNMLNDCLNSRSKPWERTRLGTLLLMGHQYYCPNELTPYV